MPPQPRFKDKGLPTMRQKCSVEWWSGHLQFFSRAHQPRADFALRALSACPCARKSDGVRRTEWRAGRRREREGDDINVSPHADHISARCSRICSSSHTLGVSLVHRDVVMAHLFIAERGRSYVADGGLDSWWEPPREGGRLRAKATASAMACLSR